MNKNEIKKNILDAWILVERLSEGDISDKNKQILMFDNLNDNNFYQYIPSEINKKNSSKKKENKGFAIYFDVFDFNEVISIIRKKYNLKSTEEELKTGNKFSFVIYFDKEMNLQKDKIFLTQSGYIRYHKEIPTQDDFAKYEDDFKNLLEQKFDKTSEDADKFNEAMCEVLQKYNISVENCRWQYENIQDDANLHSFFIDDLEKSKKIDTINLDKYLFGDDKNRVNLDSKSDSDNFNPKAFESILQPDNYPLGRFPSNPDFALSFMQQVAVNLSTGYDNKSIRSVNGPPGTGKTTLLKDVFAELVVEQAYDIVRLSDKKIKGTVETRYYKEKSIGVLPEHITEKGIVVASSNNGAVKNIVNELPLESQIDKKFIDEVKKVDYFHNLSNKEVSVEWKEDGNGKKTSEIKAEPKKDACWGLFSLEGGRKANVDKIIANIELICKYFDEGYVSNEKVYREFIDKYNEVKKLREEKQKLAQILQKDKYSNLEFFEIQDKYESEYPDLLDDLKKKAEKAKSDGKDEILKEINTEKERIEKGKRKFENFKTLKKPHIFSSKSDKQVYKDKVNEAVKIMKELLNVLDMNKPYDELQLSNPWFSRRYRIAQSELFIKALAVRKQFLYDNRENLKAATNIWTFQQKYLENKIVIEAAWGWINMAIPVISSTFASFPRMCRNLEKDKLGHLFIDEAGQALPQAAVGAIFRSRHVMVVGDPSQIKPVLTLDSNILSMICKNFHITEKHLSVSTSTQTLVDAASGYGYYKEKDKSDESWIGIPLWVHRRCQYPMFTISNVISYNGLMVQGKPGNGKTGWFDVKGTANDKYVKEQGEFLLQKINQMIKENPEIKDKIYVITPFRNVAKCLVKKLGDDFVIREDDGKPKNVGTIHTFQGKEASVVFMVLGADEKSDGSARWAVSEANMMNVAATRAKDEFYIIGDKTLYRGLGSEVVSDTYKVIEQYKKEHPDLIDENADDIDSLQQTTINETKDNPPRIANGWNKFRK